MTYRRTWFGYGLWFLYTVLCIVLIAVESKEWLQHFAGIGIIFPRIIYALPVIPIAALYWFIKSIAAKIRKKWMWKEHVAVILECTVFLLFMAVVLLNRIMALNYVAALLARHGESTINLFPESSMRFFDMATVSDRGINMPMDRGIEDLYVMLLSVVLSFLGNREVSAVFLQIVLQVIGIVLIYTVTRKIAGRLPACIVLLYFALSKTCLDMLEYFEPEWLFFVLYMIGMLIAVSFVKAYCANRICKPLAVIGAAVVGAVIGGLTYLDLVAASLLIVILITAVGKKNRQDEVPVHNSAGVSAAVILTAVLVCTAVWFGTIAVASYMSGTNLTGDVFWNRLFTCLGNSYFYTSRKPYSNDLYLIAVLIVPASFLAFEFFRSGREQNFMPWILLCLIAAPTPMAVYGEHGYGILSLYVWAVLAGLGLQNCILGDKKKVMKAVIEEINTTVEKAEETEEIAKTNYIENPLPLPKKHVAREMDYRYEVEEQNMKYDVEVPENDDFDLK